VRASFQFDALVIGTIVFLRCACFGIATPDYVPYLGRCLSDVIRDYGGGHGSTRRGIWHYWQFGTTLLAHDEALDTRYDARLSSTRQTN
jgi:hypothetical protein